MNGVARALMAAGVVIFLAGAAVWLASRFGIPLGRLPGDITWEGKNIKVYSPFATMLVISVILTIILNVLSRLWKK
jgi:hypothetical protein